MSKMSELSAMIDSLITCGETLAETGRALKDFYSNTSEEASNKIIEQKISHLRLLVADFRIYFFLLFVFGFCGLADFA